MPNFHDVLCKMRGMGINMNKSQFNEIKDRLPQFTYNSLNYTDYDEIPEYQTLYNDDKTIILYGYDVEQKIHKYLWACSNQEELVRRLKRRNERELITFVPANWVSPLNNIGFEVYAVWNDYFASELSIYVNSEEPVFINQNNCNEASLITLSCTGQSRGFSGQSEEWMKQWIGNAGPAVPEYTRECAVIASFNHEMSGVVCVAIYGDGEKTTLWIREIAIKPEFQGRGIAKKLLRQAFAYGIKHGAKKAFLMADECNNRAIGLYKSMGFQAAVDGCQIDMNR